MLICLKSKAYDKETLCKVLYINTLHSNSKLLLSQMPVVTWSNYSAIDASKNNPSLLSSSFCYAEFGSDLNINLYNDFYFLNSKDYTDLLRYRTTSDYFIKGKNYPVGFVLNTSTTIPTSFQTD